MPPRGGHTSSHARASSSGQGRQTAVTVQSVLHCASSRRVPSRHSASSSLCVALARLAVCPARRASALCSLCTGAGGPPGCDAPPSAGASAARIKSGVSASAPRVSRQDACASSPSRATAAHTCAPRTRRRARTRAAAAEAALCTTLHSCGSCSAQNTAMTARGARAARGLGGNAALRRGPGRVGGQVALAQKRRCAARRVLGGVIFMHSRVLFSCSSRVLAVSRCAAVTTKSWRSISRRSALQLQGGKSGVSASTRAARKGKRETFKRLVFFMMLQKFGGGRASGLVLECRHTTAAHSAARKRTG